MVVIKPVRAWLPRPPPRPATSPPPARDPTLKPCYTIYKLTTNKLALCTAHGAVNTFQVKTLKFPKRLRGCHSLHWINAQIRPREQKYILHSYDYDGIQGPELICKMQRRNANVTKDAVFTSGLKKIESVLPLCWRRHETHRVKGPIHGPNSICKSSRRQR